MFYARHRNQKPGPSLAPKRRRHGRRVSVDTHSGISLVQEPKDTVGNWSNGMKPTSCGFGTCDVSRFYARSSVNLYYDNLKPFLLVLRAMGVLPLSSEAGGAVVFSWTSLAMLYSVCLYLLLCFAVWFTNENRRTDIRKADGRFEDAVDAYILFVYLVPLAYLPFTYWPETAKVAKYLNEWSAFQIHYHQVTGETLVLPLKCRCLTAVVLTLSLSHISILASYDFVTSVKNVPDVLLYSYLVSLMNLTGLCLYFTFTVLSRSAAALEERLSKALDRSPMWAEVLAQYRLLWLDLSHLAKQAGAVSCYTCGCYLVHQFFMVALSAYATLSDVIAGNWDTKFLDNCIIFSASMILAICEGANNVCLKADVAFQRKLLRLQTVTYNKATHLQVSAFLQTISAEPPVISLGGYVRINRELLVAFGSTLVTYLIVLLQLKFSVAGTSHLPHNTERATRNISAGLLQ